MTHRVLKSHRSKMSVMYICSQKDRQCALPVITNAPMAPWQTVHHVPKCMSCHRTYSDIRHIYTHIVNKQNYVFKIINIRCSILIFKLDVKDVCRREKLCL